jgi:sugar/nucleoside kinase (ribokinase family)
MSSESCDIFVIGTASLDILHFAGQTAHTAGGAGLYTALAAHRAGARTGLFAPKPDPMPASLQPIAERVRWVGPSISPEDLPRLEIEHHGGGRATLVGASWGAESQLTPEIIPPKIFDASIVHIAALSTAQRQLDFLQALWRKGVVDGDDAGLATVTRSPLISVGTYARLVYGDPDRVRQLLAGADLFFMNGNEATGLFGRVEDAHSRPGSLLFVTLGEAGALVIEGEQVSHVPGHPASELDPTGAGDTVCGATLAALTRGETPVDAARQAVILAAKTVKAVGPAALL